MLLQLFAISLGATAGAIARWELSLWLNGNPGILPLGTLAANLIGGYLIGICIATFQAHPQLDPAWRLLLVTGFLGALTTFSTFSAEVVGMLQTDRYALALVTTLLHVVGSLVLTVLGMKSAAWVLAR